MTYQVDDKRLYLRRCSWGEDWRVLEPVGLRLNCAYDARFHNNPVTLNIFDGERWHTEMWYSPGYTGDLP